MGDLRHIAFCWILGHGSGTLFYGLGILDSRFHCRDRLLCNRPVDRLSIVSHKRHACFASLADDLTHQFARCQVRRCVLIVAEAFNTWTCCAGAYEPFVHGLVELILTRSVIEGFCVPQSRFLKLRFWGFETRRSPVFRARTPAQSTRVLVLESGLSRTITSTISLSTSTTS